MKKALDVWNIEVGRMSDVDVLEKLYNELNDYLEKGVNYSGWRKDVYPTRETAESGIEEGNLFVLKSEGNIIGSIIVNHKQEEAYNQATWGFEADDSQILVIHTLAVHPVFMNMGIAERLMTFAKDYAIQKTMKSIRLDVAIQNTPAIALYEKCGYSYVGTVDLGLPYDNLKWFNLYELIL